VSEPTTLLLRMDVGGGDLERRCFEQAWSALAQAAARATGHLGDELWRDAETAGRYWIRTQWADRSDFQQFTESQAHHEFRGQIHKLTTSRSVSRMQLVAAVGGTRAVTGPAPATAPPS
jgi:heme-degrading monooxygenase HmoA